MGLSAPPASHDPGCGRLRPLMPGVTGAAVFGGPGDCYRYRLERRWDGDGTTVMFVMMNPSGADPMLDDATVFKVQKMARGWAPLFGRPVVRVLVGNTFAYRAKDQKRLLEVQDPVGPDNNAHLLDMARAAGVVVFAYGLPKHGSLLARGRYVVRMLVAQNITAFALRVSNVETPWHPLYLPDTTQPFRWTPSWLHDKETAHASA